MSDPVSIKFATAGVGAVAGALPAAYTNIVQAPKRVRALHDRVLRVRTIVNDEDSARELDDVSDQLEQWLQLLATRRHAISLNVMTGGERDALVAAGKDLDDRQIEHIHMTVLDLRKQVKALIEEKRRVGPPASMSAAAAARAGNVEMNHSEYGAAGAYSSDFRANASAAQIAARGAVVDRGLAAPHRANMSYFNSSVHGPAGSGSAVIGSVEQEEEEDVDEEPAVKV